MTAAEKAKRLAKKALADKSWSGQARRERAEAKKGESAWKTGAF